MLFYNQIKREFSSASWRRGQIYFREERVKDVRLEGDLVVGKVQGTDVAAYETAIMMARGTIFNSKCSCPAHRLYETHCKHVAALSIWVVERGSLLRLGIASKDYGVAEGEHNVVLRDPAAAMLDVRLRKLLMSHPELSEVSFMVRKDKMAGFIQGNDKSGRSFSIPITLVEAIALHEHGDREDQARAKPEPVRAEPVAFVRGMFQNKALTAISVESALRYTNPESQTVQVATFQYLVPQPEPGVFRTSDGIFVKPTNDPIPVLQSIHAAKLFYQGPAALENLAKLMTTEPNDRIVFHPSVQLEIDPTPLKLTSLNIGRKTEKARNISYEFKNKTVRLDSNELAELREQGKVSSQFIWKDNKLYRLETSLTLLSQFANRTGVASPEGLNEIHDDATTPLHPLAAYRLSLELGVDTFTVDPEWKEFHEWKDTFEKKKTALLPTVDYGFTLREYQKNGLTWLWSLHDRGLAALLADDMGLGKTHQVLALLTSLYKSKKKPTKPSLVIAPTSVVSAWIQKLEKYDTSLKWSVFHGKGRVLPKSDVNLVLTTYGILQREPALREREWHIVMLDEAQAIKNAGTLSSRASRAMKSKYRIAMTGTPVENHATDLWSIMEFLIPGYLGSLPRFKRLYGSGREEPSATQAQVLRRLVQPFLLRRTKSQVLKELPEKTEEVVHCEMTAVQKKVYRAYLNSSEAESVRTSLEGNGKVNYANVLSLLTRLKQVCDHPRLPEMTGGKIKKIKSIKALDTGKWEAFEEILNEALGSNLKVVVFTQYLGMMDLIGQHLKDTGVRFTELRGDTVDRSARLKLFAEDADCKVFLCSLLAGSLGIDLTAASVCIHIDRWWNPARENQATDRLHRIGQTRGVQVFKLQIPGTVEDRIASIIQSKVALSDALIEESSLGLKAFSRKQLLDLLAPME